MTKLSFSNIAWSPLNNENIYKVLQDNGFHGLEVAPTIVFNGTYSPSSSQIKEFLNSLKKYSLHVSSMQSILFGRDDLKLFENEESRKALLGHLKIVLKLAQSLKCPNLVFGSPKNRIIYQQEHMTAIDTAIDFFLEVASIAKPLGVNVLIEANPKEYGTNFLNTTLDTIRFINKVGRSNIGLNLDLGTVLMNKENLEELIKSASEILKHVHISLPYLQIISDYSNNALYDKLKGLLLDIKYKGYISVEMRKESEVSKEVLSVKKTIKIIKTVF